MYSDQSAAINSPPFVAAWSKLLAVFAMLEIYFGTIVIYASQSVAANPLFILYSCLGYLIGQISVVNGILGVVGFGVNKQIVGIFGINSQIVYKIRFVVNIANSIALFLFVCVSGFVVRSFMPREDRSKTHQDQSQKNDNEYRSAQSQSQKNVHDYQLEAERFPMMALIAAFINSVFGFFLLIFHIISAIFLGLSLRTVPTYLRPIVGQAPIPSKTPTQSQGHVPIPSKVQAPPIPGPSQVQIQNETGSRIGPSKGKIGLAEASTRSKSVSGKS